RAAGRISIAPAAPSSSTSPATSSPARAPPPRWPRSSARIAASTRSRRRTAPRVRSSPSSSRSARSGTLRRLPSDEEVIESAKEEVPLFGGLAVVPHLERLVVPRHADDVDDLDRVRHADEELEADRRKPLLLFEVV